MDIQGLMRQAQEMQKKMQKAQEELANNTYEAEAGGGMVKAIVTGDGLAKKFDIDPSLLEDDKEILEDLLVAAFNNAKKKADEEGASAMKGATGGMPLPPGFKM